jgi:hypothetical protein
VLRITAVCDMKHLEVFGYKHVGVCPARGSIQGRFARSVTAKSDSHHSDCLDDRIKISVVDRIAEERQYVLAILYRMREEVAINPDSFDADAQARIDNTIALLQPEGEQAHVA